LLLPRNTAFSAPELAWRKIETLGNFLRHEYRDIDADVIWSITQENLPLLLKVSRRLADRLRDKAPA
jgi:uncharacterized protein with HEPN domain